MAVIRAGVGWGISGSIQPMARAMPRSALRQSDLFAEAPYQSDIWAERLLAAFADAEPPFGFPAARGAGDRGVPRRCVRSYAGRHGGAARGAAGAGAGLPETIFQARVGARRTSLACAGAQPAQQTGRGQGAAGAQWPDRLAGPPLQPFRADPSACRGCGGNSIPSWAAKTASPAGGRRRAPKSSRGPRRRPSMAALPRKPPTASGVAAASMPPPLPRIDIEIPFTVEFDAAPLLSAVGARPGAGRPLVRPARAACPSRPGAGLRRAPVPAASHRRRAAAASDRNGAQGAEAVPRPRPACR